MRVRQRVFHLEKTMEPSRERVKASAMVKVRVSLMVHRKEDHLELSKVYQKEIVRALCWN